MFLQGNFFHKGKKHKLTLKEDGLSWDPEGTPDLRQCVLPSEIIGCWLCPRGSLSCSQAHSHTNPKECLHWKDVNGGLSVEICMRREKMRWAPTIFVFLHPAKEVLLAWHAAIWDVLYGLPNRPRRLLVVINPVGGRRKAKHIFEKKVAPLLQRAKIQTIETSTEYKGHGTRLVQEAGTSGLLKEFDGVVAVGGDGLVSEVVTGLFVLSSLSQGVDPHDLQTNLPVTQIRLGIIPSGSTDATCFATHGSSEVITAVLHIIMGDQRGVDVAVIHSGNKLLRVATSLVSYGYFGDLLRSSERWRCLGPPRYLLSGLQQIIRNRSYPVKIKVKKPQKNSSGGNNDSCNSIRSTVSCTSICSVCSQMENKVTSGDDSGYTWEEVNGNFSVVSAAVTSCACRLTPQGVSPSAHLGDGHTDLILVKGSSRAKLLSYLYHTSVTGNAVNLNHVQMIRGNEIQFSAAPESHSLWNCDGEEIESTSLTIKVHRQKLLLFCRGIEDPFPVSTHKLKVPFT